MATRAYRHFDTTAPTVTNCRQCRQTIIRGLAEGIPARVDPNPLPGIAGEQAALDAGRLTFTLTRSGLVQRDAIRRTDPNLTGPVLAAHDCPRRNA